MKKILLTLVLSLLFIPTAYADRLFTLGFELQSLTAGEDFTSAGLGGGWGTINTATTSAVHSGVASFQNKPTTSASSWIGNVFRADGATSVVYARCYVYIVTLPSANGVELCGFWDSVAVNRRATIMLTSGGVGQLLTDSNAQVGSNSSALSLNTWYCVQISAEGTNAGTEHLEGSIEAGECTTAPSAFATTETTTIADFNALYVGSPNASATYDVYWDDIAINDVATTTMGSAQITYPGGGKIVYLRPTASGDSASTLGAFGDIDETNPNDATDFIDLDDATSIGQYNFTNTSGLIDSYDTITLVDVGVRLREEASAGTSYQLGVKSASGGVVASSTARDGGDTTWRTNQVGTTAMTNRLVVGADPTGSGTNGYTTQGANDYQFVSTTVNNPAGLLVTLSSNTWVTGVQAYVKYTTQAKAVNMQIYAGSAGAIGASLAITPQGYDTPSTSYTLEKRYFSVPIYLTAGTYWVQVIGNEEGPGTGGALVAYDTGGATDTGYTKSDVGVPTYNTNQYSIALITTQAWTPTGTNSIENMQIGGASLTANDIDISTLWAEVEYVDGSAPAGGTTVKQSIFWDE